MKDHRGTAHTSAARHLTTRLIHPTQVLIDIGTGDGRFVEYMARVHPTWQVIGVDACREQMRKAMRKTPPNAEFVVANAFVLPQHLHGAATQLTVNFPWGSLLQGLLDEHRDFMAQLALLVQPNAALDVRVNAGALAEAGWEFEPGVERVCSMLVATGSNLRATNMLDAVTLRTIPSTWAKRLAFGRDPRACHLCASYRG